MVVGIAVAFGWPWIIGRRPSSEATYEVKLEFLKRGVALVGVSVLCFALAVIGALLIVRQAREEYNDARTENLKELIEGTQEDIRKKQDVES
ncbi:MAG: hypothetical protein JST12_17025 [Armatimonadetes bacterium]|nr:hypothetical protein [Armatimonadota bacterium]MBS1703368.1 hypothetical protein [Armatimonadota bacterium]MBS1727451.1 hypothetical protein [Armatimonadota bacterium]